MSVNDNHTTGEGTASSEKRYRELTDLLPETVFELDVNGKVTFVNDAGLKAYGYAREDFDDGLNVVELHIERDRDRLNQRIKDAKGGGKLDMSEYTALRKDGTTFPVLVHSNPILQNGKLAGFCGIVFDIFS